jgi:hypothetical protein
MTKGSYTTTRIKVSPPPLTGLHLNPRVYEYEDLSGGTWRRTLEPLAFPIPIVAAELADKWLEVSAETPSAGVTLGVAVERFLDDVGGQLRAVRKVGDMRLSDIRRRHIDAWEMRLLTQHRASGTNTHYRYSVYMLALLRRIESDAPGSLHPEVVDRLEQDSRLRHVRNPGLEPFTTNETKRLRAAAHRMVFRALQSTPAQSANRNVLVALNVLLALSTGEPPEVIRGMSVDHLQVTASSAYDEATARMTPRDRMTWLAQQDGIEAFAVTFVKNRAGGEERREVYTRTSRAAYAALLALLVLTAEDARGSTEDSLWLTRRPSGVLAQPRWNSRGWSLKRWIESQGIEVEGPLVWSRFRKVVVAREAVRDGGLYLRRERRHTSGVFFNHYSQSAVIEARGGALLVQGIQGYFDAAVHGAVVVTPEAEQLLLDGQECDALSVDMAASLLSGDLDGPHTACRNPEDSPFEPAGETCGQATTGKCFGCSNALITQSHLPAAILIRDLSDPRRAADPAAWLATWKDIHEFVTAIVLPAFSEEQVAAASELVASVPVDLGVANDMRGANQDV